MAHRRAPRLRWVALSAAALLTWSCGGDDPEVSRDLVGYRPSAEQRVDTVTMPDASNGGEPFEFRAAEGELLIAYFGYTSCPDVCPTSLAALKSALRGLGDDAAKVDVAMATVDPARDTAEVISGYVQSFVPDAHGLRTDDATELRRATEVFGVTFGVSTNDEGEVEVTHSGAMYVVDDTGVVVLTWPFGVTSDDIRADLEILIDEAAA